MNAKEFSARIEQAGVDNFPHKKMCSPLFYFISANLGIPDNDIISYIVPLIAKTLQTLEETALTTREKTAQLKEEVQRFVNTKNLSLLLPSICIKQNNTPNQRRMDSLARLLSLEISITPCIAVSILKNTLYIASNSSTSSTCVITHLKNKLNILRAYLLGTENKGNCFNALISSDNGGYDSLGKKPEAALKRLDLDFNKLFSEPGKQNTLVNTVIHCIIENKFEIIAPDIIFGENIHHAEQVLLTNIIDFKSDNTEENPFYIGVSKLCCRTCFLVLSAYSTQYALSFRGTHGVSFSRVNDSTGSRFLPPPQKEKLMASLTQGNTKYSANLYPSDSDSDAEIYTHPL